MPQQPVKVLFLQSAHAEHDDRVFYHQRMSLQKHGCEVSILSTFRQGLSKQQEFRQVRMALKREQPKYVICDTPKMVLYAQWGGANVIYDVTEWYPSKKNLRDRGTLKILLAPLMLCLNLLAGLCANQFVFGERSKAKLFCLFFWKRSVLLPYYPSLRLFSAPVYGSLSNRCRILYAGPLTAEKGWQRVQDAVAYCREQRPDYEFVLDVISPERYMSLPDFCQYIGNADICVDLRDMDVENTRCLPIKIFYYMAAAKPVVYSRLNAIKEGIPEIEQFGVLAQNSRQAAEAILAYIDNPASYVSAAHTAYDLYCRKYNWEQIEQRLFQLIR